MASEKNQLVYGDNLNTLKSMPSELVDLVYLDPPFNSEAVYNVGFAKAGDASAQIQAFDDTWTWTTETSDTYDFLVADGGLPDLAAEALSAVRALAKESPLTAYMVMMAPRLVELHRVLKDSGSLYLHCDPNASHYLKVMLDAIFGPKSFRNEIIWRRTGGHAPRKSFGPMHDVILFYTKRQNGYYFQTIRTPYTREHVSQRYKLQPDGRLKFTSGGNVLTGAGKSGGESGMPWRGFDPSAKNRHWAIPGFVNEQLPIDVQSSGVLAKLESAYQLGLVEILPDRVWPEPTRYLTESSGQSAGDMWAFQPGTAGTLHGTEEGIDADVAYLGPTSPERLGYPTQKPVGLMERIIRASCPEGGLVLDPFCGCGTTIAAAENLGRRWIGIDITFIAIDLIRNRLRTTYGDDIENEIEVLGVPEDLAAAQSLFERDPFDFERWAVSLVNGTPNQKKGGDQGRDGIVRYYRGKKEKPGQVVVSVKGGKQLHPSFVRDLAGVVAQDVKLSAGLLITMWQPTKGMYDTAARAGTWKDPAAVSHPKIEILTIPELLSGKKAEIPMVIPPYAEAKPIKETGEQLALVLDVEEDESE